MGVIDQKKAAREDLLLSALRRKKSMNMMEVTALLQISEATARRFVGELEDKGVLVRTYGGVRLVPESFREYSTQDSQRLHMEEKQRIAQHAVSFVQSGDLIYLDNGTTLHCFASIVAQNIQNGNLRDLQVYTNSLITLQILADHCEVNLIGGQYRSKRQDFSGYLTEMVLDSICFQKAFLGTDAIGFGPKEGLMTTDAATAKVNQLMMHRSSETYLLVDSSKFQRRSFLRYASPKDAHLIITDTGLPQDLYDMCLNQHVAVVRV